jgi:transporter family-2 protein
LFVGFAVTAALLMSLAIDHFGWFRMNLHPLNTWRSLGGVLFVAGTDNQILKALQVTT